MYYIITEDGEVFQTFDRKAAMDASDEEMTIVIDAENKVCLYEREAVKIEEWELPADEGGDNDEDNDG